MNDNNAYIVFTKLLLLVGREKGEWAGGRRQLAELVNVNDNTLKHVLNRLEDQQIITRQVTRKYSIISICNWSTYQHTTDPLSDPEVTHSRPTADHSNKNKKKKRTYSDFEHLEPELTEFVKMRKLIKKPMTPEAITRLVAKLEKLYPDDTARQKACLTQAIDHSWQNVYPLKDEDILTRKDTHAWT